MGATNRRLRGQLSFKKLQEGREDWNVSQILIQGKRRKTRWYPAHQSPQKWRTYQFGGNGAAASRPASRQVLWLMASAEEPWAQDEHHLQAAASDDEIGILKIHAIASAGDIPPCGSCPPWKFPEMWLGIPQRHSHSVASPSTNPAPITQLLPLRGVDHRDAFRNLGILSFLSVNTSLEAWP